MQDRFVSQPASRVPVRGEFDVAVVGGGVAGVAAAVAAARSGAKVCLLEKENALGGLATLGLVVIYLPLCDGRGTQVAAGLAEELLKASIKYGPGEIPAAWRRRGSRAARTRQRYLVTFNPGAFMLALDELLVRERIKIFFDTRFCAVRKAGGRIETLFIENKDGRGALRVRAVVDASGDADVCACAGEPTASRADNRRAGWFYIWEAGQVRLVQLHDHFGGPPVPGQPGFAGDVADDVTDHSLDGREMILEHLLMRRGRRGRGAVYPLMLPMVPQFRMTRRLRGAFELDLADERRVFPDAVGMTGDWRQAGPAYQIPLRCLAGVRTDNLLAAGRCISVTDAAWDFTRAIPACAVTGEAAGVAAALAARRRTRLDGLRPEILRRALRTRGVLLDDALLVR
jgi:hypothetical protein